MTNVHRPPSTVSHAPLSPRERVRAALAHRQPDRVPFSWGFGPTSEMSAALESYLGARGISWRALRRASDDVRMVVPRYTGPELAPDADIWGIRRRPISYGGGSYNEFEHYPLAGAQTAAEVEAHPWPSAEDYDYAHLREEALVDDPQLLRAGRLTSGNPFEIYCWMTGLERSLTNLLLNPEVVCAGLEQITRFFEAKLRRTLESCGDLIDLLFFADDLGSQKGLLMSRATYRRLLQPYHRRLFSLGKHLAPHAFALLHSDGAVFDILPDLLDAGLEVLEAVQVDAAGMDPARLKQTYGARLAFHGGISVQALLPHGDAETVRAECRRLVEVFGQGGGYVAAPSHAIQVGTPPENVLAVLEAVLGPGDYRAALDSARL